MSVVISPSIVENELVYPLKNARIGYDTIVRGGVITASSEATGFPADAIARETTWERWKPAALPATLDITSATVTDVDYAGIAAHTLGSNGCTVAVQYAYSLDENDPAYFQAINEQEQASLTLDFAAQEYDVIEGPYATIETLVPADDSAIMALFPEAPAKYWRLNVSGVTAPTIGVVYLGKALAMPRSIYGGHSPITLSRQTTIRPNQSEKGQWLGRSIVRQGVAASYKWEHLTADWYRAEFDPFVQDARKYPFFIAWKPSTFPKEVAYGWVNEDIRPSNSGKRDFMDVAISVSGFVG